MMAVDGSNAVIGDEVPASRYDARSIEVFPGLEAVRRHPSMYVGSAGTEGLHPLVRELLDHTADEAAAGWCPTSVATFNATPLRPTNSQN